MMYEYRVQSRFSLIGHKMFGWEERLNEILNKMGADRWQLVSVDGELFYFMREVQR